MNPILSFIIILSILILVHEIGHFVVARWFKIKIEEFGLGYPPRIWSKKVRETIYSINWLPFGGFVRMLGEDSKEQVDNKQDIGRAFFKQKKRVKVAVLLAGVMMNFLLGVVVFAAIYTKIGIPELVDYVVVSGIAKDSPAEAVGLKPEDKVVTAEGWEKPDKKELVTSFVKYISDHRGEEVKLNLQDGRQVVAVPRLEADTPEGQGALGAGVSNVDLVMYPVWQRPFRGMVVGIQEALAWGREIVVSLGMMMFNLFKGQVPEQVAGPVGIYDISKQVVAQGLMATLQFMGILSINLSILNLLPIPALDGGRLFFIAIEAITRKRIKPELEQTIHLIGMMLLIGLMLLITVNDVKRLLG